MSNLHAVYQEQGRKHVEFDAASKMQNKFEETTAALPVVKEISCHPSKQFAIGETFQQSGAS